METYKRKQWKERFRYKQSYYFWLKMTRLVNMLSEAASYRQMKLNNCGWLFKTGDYNHQLYKDYQEAEELIRLAYWCVNIAYDKDVSQLMRLTLEERKYIISIAERMSDAIGKCNSPMYSMMAEGYVKDMKRNLQSDDIYKKKSTLPK